MENHDLGKHEIRYYSVDNLLNVEAVNVEVVNKIDFSIAELTVRISLVLIAGIVEIVINVFLFKKVVNVKKRIGQN